MRKLTLLLFLCALSVAALAQTPLVPAGATMIVKNPKWEAEDKAKLQQYMKDKAQEFALWKKELENSNEHLKSVKKATEKLREVNKRLRNYRHMEEAIRMTTNAYIFYGNFIRQLEQDDLFSIEEYRQMTQQASFLLQSTTYSLDMIKVVLADFKIEANDYERIVLLDKYLETLRKDVNTLYLFAWELEQVNNQRMQLRTLDYMRQLYSGKPMHNGGN